MFILDKWYLDLVTPDGGVCIGYAARINWGALRFNFASLLTSPATEPASERSTVRGATEPTEGPGAVSWVNDAVGIAGIWTGTDPIEARLIETPAGTIDWRCLAPKAEVSLQVGDRTWAGLGYAEHLQLSIPPWALPFNRLLWGRFVSPRHTVIWIEWTGGTHHRWVWMDGVLQPEAIPTLRGVHHLGHGASVTWRASRDLRNQSVLGWLGEQLPGVAKRLTGRLDAMHEHKMVSPALLSGLEPEPEPGWTIHEEVRW